MVDGTIIVMHVAVHNVEVDLGVNEIDVFAQAHLAEPCVKFFFGGCESFDLVVVVGFAPRNRASPFSIGRRVEERDGHTRLKHL